MSEYHYFSLKLFLPFITFCALITYTTWLNRMARGHIKGAGVSRHLGFRNHLTSAFAVLIKNKLYSSSSFLIELSALCLLLISFFSLPFSIPFSFETASAEATFTGGQDIFIVALPLVLCLVLFPFIYFEKLEMSEGLSLLKILKKNFLIVLLLFSCLINILAMFKETDLQVIIQSQLGLYGGFFPAWGVLRTPVIAFIFFYLILIVQTEHQNKRQTITIGAQSILRDKFILAFTRSSITLVLTALNIIFFYGGYNLFFPFEYVFDTFQINLYLLQYICFFLKMIFFISVVSLVKKTMPSSSFTKQVKQLEVLLIFSILNFLLYMLLVYFDLEIML
jgi:hypothetical protein